MSCRSGKGRSTPPPRGLRHPPFSSPSLCRTHLRPLGVTIDDSSVTETNNTQQQEQQERKLSQKRKTLVSGDVLLESQMSVPRSYLLPLSAIQKHRPPETCPIKRFLPSGESSSQRPRPPGFEVRMRTLATPQPRLPSRERLSLHPWISFTCNSAFWSGPHFFVFFVKFILEAEREREGEVDLLFHLVVHSLVSSWICS